MPDLLKLRERISSTVPGVIDHAQLWAWVASIGLGRSQHTTSRVRSFAFRGSRSRPVSREYDDGGSAHVLAVDLFLDFACGVVLNQAIMELSRCEACSARSTGCEAAACWSLVLCCRFKSQTVATSLAAQFCPVTHRLTFAAEGMKRSQGIYQALLADFVRMRHNSGTDIFSIHDKMVSSAVRALRCRSLWCNPANTSFDRLLRPAC